MEMNSLSSDGVGGIPRALILRTCQLGFRLLFGEGGRRMWCTYMSADLRSLMGSTPFFSPSIGSEKRLYASFISPSSCAVTLCSFASFERRGLGVVVEEDAAAP